MVPNSTVFLICIAWCQAPIYLTVMVGLFVLEEPAKFVISSYPWVVCFSYDSRASLSLWIVILGLEASTWILDYVSLR